jgi:hypothetical protein
MSDQTRIALIWVAIAVGCIVLVPLLGGAMLRLACKMTGVQGVRYKRCWLAYLSAYAVASVVAVPLFFVLPRSSFGTPASSSMGIIFLIALCIHALIVPKVLGTPVRRTLAAHGIAIVLTGCIILVMSLPLFFYARSEAQRVARMFQFREIYHAMEGYSDTMSGRRGLPPPAIYSKDGKPLLSWRVALLPYMEQQPLYQQFHLDEPWDSSHNLTLVARMPRVYGEGDKELDGAGKTRLRIFVSSQRSELQSPFIIGDKKGTSYDRIKDGASSTVAVIEMAETTIWTRPDEPEFVAGQPLPALGNPDRDQRVFVLYADGVVQIHRTDRTQAGWQAVITMSGNEPVSAD